MGARFIFSAFGILAIAALCIFLYVSFTAAGNPDIGATLLEMAQYIVLGFIAYMFVKLFLSARAKQK